MIRAVTFTNYLGDSIRLDLARPEESGFIIKSVTGLGPGKANINTTEIATNDGSDDALTDAEYMAQLQQRGKEKLAENVSITSFEGETETTIMFQYGKDFFNGDIVQIANEYGHETKARILEIVRSEDKDGYSVYPTFKTIEQEGA